MEFVKMEGLGNDFVVVLGPFEPTAEQVAAWCDRRRGIGADGVLTVTAVDDTTVAMGYWNADGSAAEMCGNGLRCVARYAVDAGLVSLASFRVVTPIGARSVEVGDEMVRAELGPVTVGGEETIGGYTLTTASVGNPHAVTFVDDTFETPVVVVGALIERDPAFPGGTNVEFATVSGEDQIYLRVWERGVGETLACGTGAAATAAVAHAQGRVGPEVMIRLPGGDLQVTLKEGTAWIEGPAVTVYSGVLA